MVVKALKSTFSDGLYFFIAEKGAVTAALAILNASILGISSSKWSKDCSSAVEIDCKLFGEVGIRAINPLASELRVLISIIEAS